MKSRLWDMLTGTRPLSPAARAPDDPHELHLAAAALLVELATVDAHFHDAERKRVLHYARDRLGLSEREAQTLVEAAERRAAHAVELHRVTQALKNGLSYEERVELVEALWEIVYADGTADPYERQLMRRLAGLIYVTDRDSGLARRRAVERIGHGEKSPRRGHGGG